MIANMLHIWQDLSLVAVCFLLMYVFPFKHRRFTHKVRERNEHDHD